MMDNTLFFVSRGLKAEIVRDAIAKTCSLSSESIILASAIGYHWEEAEFYDGKTVIQLHEYEKGDFLLELEILIGGNRLCADHKEESYFFSQLARNLKAEVLQPVDEERSFLHTQDGNAFHRRVWMPDEYGPQGPVFIS